MLWRQPLWVWFAVLVLSAEERVGHFSTDVLLVFAYLEHMQICVTEFVFEQHELIDASLAKRYGENCSCHADWACSVFTV